MSQRTIKFTRPRAKRKFASDERGERTLIQIAYRDKNVYVARDANGALHEFTVHEGAVEVSLPASVKEITVDAKNVILGNTPTTKRATHRSNNGFATPAQVKRTQF